jgi:hypothetical protein
MYDKINLNLIKDEELWINSPGKNDVLEKPSLSAVMQG